jgi:signal transduction histidine kinase
MQNEAATLPKKLQPAITESLQQQLAEAAHDLRGPINVASQLVTAVFHRLQANDSVTETELRMLCLANGRLAQASSWAARILADRRQEKEAPECRVVSASVWKASAGPLLNSIASDAVVRLLWIGWDRRLPKISIDSDHLTRAVMNLVTNACRASGAGSQLIIRALSSSQNAKWLSIRIEDQGPGLPPSIMRWLNEHSSQAVTRQTHAESNSSPKSFNTTRSSEFANSLGLRLSRSLIHGMGGKLTASRLARGGTAMLIRLPLAPACSTGRIAATRAYELSSTAKARSIPRNRRQRPQTSMPLRKPIRRTRIARDRT